MTGLDKILDQIREDAAQEADSQIAEAKKKAEELLAEARQTASANKQAALRAGEEKAQAIRDRAESSAQLERRNSMLSFKQELIRETMDGVRQDLENAPDEDYFELLLRLAALYARPGKASMRLNRRDLDRIPADFAEQLQNAVPQADIRLSAEPVAMDSGFLLEYDGIDVNCSLRAIFEEKESEMHDRLGRLLFPAEEKE